MDYYFIEYRANEMIPGDWEWYLNTYSSDPQTGMRNWLSNGDLVVHAYEFPPEMSDHVITSVSFSRVEGKRYTGKLLREPAGVRWGIVTCLRKDFADLLGPALAENAKIGQLRIRGGEVLREWVPILINKTIAIPKRKPDGPQETAEYIAEKAIYDSAKYSMILPSDLYQVVRGFHFKGCKITSCSVPDM